MIINVTSNVKQFTSQMNIFARQRLPKAVRRAVNETAKIAKKGMEQEVKAKVDRPVPFTTNRNATFISYARDSQLDKTAIIGYRDKQAEYLGYVEEGGVSRAPGKAKPVPTNAYKNAHGNLPKTKTAQIGNGKVFSGKPNGRPGGIYVRGGNKRKRTLKQIAHWETATRHTPRMRVGARVRILVERNINKLLAQKIAEAHK